VASKFHDIKIIFLDIIGAGSIRNRRSDRKKTTRLYRKSGTVGDDS
jgi:hypothetical protein